MALLLLYVDDIVLTASSGSLLHHFIHTLGYEFALTDMGNLQYFLGISVTRTNKGLFMSQQTYASELLDRASTPSCKSSTLVDATSKLLAHTGPPVSDYSLDRSVTGALQYLTFTRPDISYDVQQIFLFMYVPHEPHFQALKCILRYLKGSLDNGL